MDSQRQSVLSVLQAAQGFLIEGSFAVKLAEWVDGAESLSVQDLQNLRRLLLESAFPAAAVVPLRLAVLYIDECLLAVERFRGGSAELEVAA